MRSQGTPISGALLIEKARDFARQLQVEEFDCNESWLMRFVQAWNNVSPQTIHNCFRHCDFVHASSAGLPEEDQEKTEQDLGNIFEKFGRMLSLARLVSQ